MLKNGRRYQGVPGQADFQSMEFERYSMRVATKVPVLGADMPVDTLSTAGAAGRAEPLHDGRTAMAHRARRSCCLMLMLLAIPLGFVNPRAGSAANLILALLIFFTYSNLDQDG